MCIETSHYDGALSNSEFYCHNDENIVLYLFKIEYSKSKKVTSTIVRI